MSGAKLNRCDFDVAKCERALASEMRDLRREWVSIKVNLICMFMGKFYAVGEVNF